MANTKSVKKTPDAEGAVVAEEAIVETTTKSTPAKKIIPKDIDPHQTVVVKNGFQGKLIYKSSKTGERFVWDEFGDEQDMELVELRNAKGAHKDFFINNWFMFDEPWVVEYLGMSRYYKNAVNIEDFDSLFKKDPSELEGILSEMSDGQKKSVGYRARVLIHENEIDSLKIINVIEKCLCIELIEK